jgi:hypothetical protein
VNKALQPRCSHALLWLWGGDRRQLQQGKLALSHEEGHHLSIGGLGARFFWVLWLDSEGPQLPIVVRA